MKKFLISATTALATLALAGGVASAQVGEYTFDDDESVSSFSICSDPGEAPVLSYSVTFNQVLKGDATLTLIFDNGTIGPFPFTSSTGEATFPTTAGYAADGWGFVDDQWVQPGPDISMTAVITDTGDGNATYTSDAEPVEYRDENCPVAALPPESTTTTTTTTTAPGQTQQPPPGQVPLPSTGLSTFETGMRLGALLLIGGLGFVIVARRRRFSSTAAT